MEKSLVNRWCTSFAVATALTSTLVASCGSNTFSGEKKLKASNGDANESNEMAGKSSADKRPSNSKEGPGSSADQGQENFEASSSPNNVSGSYLTSACNLAPGFDASNVPLNSSSTVPIECLFFEAKTKQPFKSKIVSGNFNLIVENVATLVSPKFSFAANGQARAEFSIFQDQWAAGLVLVQNSIVWVDPVTGATFSQSSDIVSDIKVHPEPLPSPVPSVTASLLPSPSPSPMPSVTASPVPAVTASPVPSVTALPMPSVTASPTPSPAPTPVTSPSPVTAQGLFGIVYETSGLNGGTGPNGSMPDFTKLVPKSSVNIPFSSNQMTGALMTYPGVVIGLATQDQTVGVTTNNYAIRFQGFLRIPAAADYEFELSTQLGMSLSINGANLVTIPHDSDNSVHSKSKKANLPAGRLKVELVLSSSADFPTFILKWKKHGSSSSSWTPMVFADFEQ